MVYVGQTDPTRASITLAEAICSRIRIENLRRTQHDPARDAVSSSCCCSADGTITVWAAPSWDCLKTLAGHRAEVTGLAVHPSGRMALSTSRFAFRCAL